LSAGGEVRNPTVNGIYTEIPFFPATRQRWLRRRGSARGCGCWRRQPVLTGQLGLRSPSSPRSGVARGGSGPPGRAEAPQALLAPCAGVSRRAPVRQSLGAPRVLRRLLGVRQPRCSQHPQRFGSLVSEGRL